MDEKTKLERAVAWLRDAEGVLVTAGAGMSVESGLPDFRGAEAFWTAYPALRWHRLTFQDMANPRVLARQPELCWGFYGHRLNLYREATPHHGFTILRSWMDRFRRGVAVYTSNVDGHFQKAGLSAKHIAECHGSIHVLQCSEVCCAELWSAADLHPVVDVERCQLISEVPLCPFCGAVARPNILMFGDYDWIALRTEQQEMHLQNWLTRVEKLVVVEVGVGKNIPMLRRFGETHSARVIRINPHDFSIAARQGVGLSERAAAGLEKLDSLLNAS